MRDRASREASTIAGIRVALTTIALAAFATIGCRSNPALELSSTELRTRMIAAIKTATHGKTHVVYNDLIHPPLEIDAQRVLHAASTMKVPVMIEFFRRIDAGDFTEGSEIVLENRFESIVDGSPYSLAPDDDSDAELYTRIGKRVTLGELCTRMIDRSSNLATNVLVERLGAPRIQTTIEGLGTQHTQVLRGVEDQKAYDRGLSNRTCARDLAVLLRSILEARAASAASCARMLAILEGQRHRSMLPAGLPPGTRIAHKTGQITKIHHDAAIIWRDDGRPFVLVVLTSGFANENDSAAIGAELARIAWQCR